MRDGEKNFTFSENLTVLRKKAGLTRRALAEKLGISEGSLKGYELDGHEPRFETLIKLSDLFGISIDSLVRPKDFLSIPYMVTTDNHGVIGGDLLSYVDSLSKKSNSGLVNCLANTLKSNIHFLSGVNGVDVFNPNESTEINLSCMSNDTKFNINLNVKIEKNPNPIPPPIQSFEEFTQMK